MPDIVGRILVVDDNAANRELLSRRLRRQGHVVEEAENGRIALERVRADPFDLVLLDVMMPEVNGYEALEVLKGDPQLRHIPVIMVTAIGETESIVRCIEMGAEDHLPKPYNPTLLRARVEASLARKQLHDREQLYARSLERELEIGRNIQRSFLPEELPRIDGWDVATCFRPAKQVAGDFYDAFALPGGGVALAIADVCGKGVGAAVFMAALRSILRASTAHAFDGATDAASDGDRLVDVVTRLNEYVAVTHSRANMFATLFIAVLRPETGALAYVNGGHDAPALRNVAGDIERLCPTGPAVGLLPGLEYRQAAATLRPGDALLAFTDGAADARSESDAAFGEERVLAELATPSSDAAELLARIEQAVWSHIGTAEQFDDVTLLALRRDPT